MVIDTNLRFDRQRSFASAACRIDTTWLTDENRRPAADTLDLRKSSSPAGRVSLAMG